MGTLEGKDDRRGVREVDRHGDGARDLVGDQHRHDANHGEAACTARDRAWPFSYRATKVHPRTQPHIKLPCVGIVSGLKSRGLEGRRKIIDSIKVRMQMNQAGSSFFDKSSGCGYECATNVL